MGKGAVMPCSVKILQSAWGTPSSAKVGVIESFEGDAEGFSWALDDMKSALLIEVLRASARHTTYNSGALRISKGVTRKRIDASILRYATSKKMYRYFESLLSKSALRGT